MILEWINSPGADGLPLKGKPVVQAARAPAHAAPDPIKLGLDPLQTRGKAEVILRHQARAIAKERP